jgi:hypothetical protein
MDNSDFLSDWNKIHLNLGAETWVIYYPIAIKK